MFCAVFCTEVLHSHKHTYMRLYCLTWPIKLCLDSFVFMFVLCYLVILHMCYIIVTRWGGHGRIEA